MTWNKALSAISSVKQFLSQSSERSDVATQNANFPRIARRRQELERRESIVNARLAQYEAAARRAAEDEIIRREQQAEEERERETIAKKREDALALREESLYAKEKALTSQIDEFETKRVQTTREFEQIANGLREKERIFDERARSARSALKEQRAQLILLCDELDRRAA